MVIEIRNKLAEIVNSVCTVKNCTKIITKCCKKAEFLLITARIRHGTSFR